MYGWDICKNPEGYTWNKYITTNTICLEYSLLYGAGIDDSM